VGAELLMIKGYLSWMESLLPAFSTLSPFPLFKINDYLYTLQSDIKKPIPFSRFTIQY